MYFFNKPKNYKFEIENGCVEIYYSTSSLDQILEDRPYFSITNDEQYYVLNTKKVKDKDKFLRILSKEEQKNFEKLTKLVEENLRVGVELTSASNPSSRTTTYHINVNNKENFSYSFGEDGDDNKDEQTKKALLSIEKNFGKEIAQRPNLLKEGYYLNKEGKEISKEAYYDNQMQIRELLGINKILDKNQELEI